MFQPVDQAHLNEPDDNLEGITDIESCWVITREDPRAPISTREYWSSQRTWVKEIEHAKVYVDQDLATNIRRTIARNPAHFFQHNGFSIATRFAYPKLGDLVDQLFKGDQDIVAMTQGLSTSVYQPRRDFRDYKNFGNPD